MTPTKVEVMKQIDRLFGNTSVPPEDTLEDLIAIRDQVEGMIDMIEEENG